MYAIDPFLAILGIVAVLTVVVGILTRWDRLPESGPAVLDCRRITRDMLDDPTLSRQEQAWLAELAVLELPRRHIIC